MLREFGHEGVAARAMAGSRAGSGRGDGLKIALRGQDENRRGRDQEQIVGSLGAPAGHQGCRSSRLLPSPRAAQPSSVAATIRPACTFLLSTTGPERDVRRARLAPLTGVAGSRRIAAAVLRGGLDPGRLDRIGVDGDAQPARQRRELRRRALQPAGRHPAQIAAITTSKPPMAPNA